MFVHVKEGTPMPRPPYTIRIWGVGLGLVALLCFAGPASAQTETKLTASDAAAGDRFGGFLTAGGFPIFRAFRPGIAISGDTVVVGAVGDDDGGNDSGSAYVFVRSGTTWTEQQKLTASDPDINHHWGESVAISGDTAVVGTDRDDDGGMDSGAAYVYALATQVPFALFDIERARVELEGGGEDEVRVRGSFVLGTGTNDLDPPNEEVLVMFDGFTFTLPAGSCVRDDDDEGFQCDALVTDGGRLRVEIRDDGEFRVKARDVDLTGIDLTNPVPFSLQIGDDVGTTAIQFDEEGRFRQ